MSAPAGARTIGAAVRSAAGLAVLVLAAGLAACGEHEFHPPPREARVAEADSLLTPALFDSIRWAGPEARLEAGSIVFATHCRDCHGHLGRGETEYDAYHHLDVPSLVRPDWRDAHDIHDLRRHIFIGHPEGMPTWGVAGIEPREVDAVAYYILEQLRPEVLGAGATDSLRP